VSGETQLTGTLIEYDEVGNFGQIQYDEEEDPVPMPPDEGEGKGLETNCKVTFVITTVKGKRQASKVARVK
jgi:cold shock CspA family protein